MPRRDTLEYPIPNPSGLAPDRKPPEIGAKQTAPDGGTPAEHAPKPEELSVEKLKVELFDREVPEECRRLALGETFVRSDAAYSDQFQYDVGLLRDGASVGEIVDEQLTAFGRFLKQNARGRAFFDLGSSHHSHAEKYVVGLGVKRYIGVDLDFLDTENAWNEGSTEFYHIGDDILRFVSQLKDQVGGVYYLSGLEPYILRNEYDQERKMRIQKYCARLMQEIWRTMQQGDVMMFGAKTSGFSPKQFGFTKLDFTELQKRDAGYPEELSTRVYIKG